MLRFFIFDFLIKKNIRATAREKSKKKLTTYGCFLFLEIAWYTISGFLYFNYKSHERIF